MRLNRSYSGGGYRCQRFGYRYEYCANLELLGFDPDFTVPEMNELQHDKYPKESGRRGIYTPSGQMDIPVDSFMRLLPKNAKTLERTYANVSLSEQQQSNAYLQAQYHRTSGELLKFERLEEFIYWTITKEEPLF